VPPTKGKPNADVQVSEPGSLWEATSVLLKDQVSETTWLTWMGELLPVEIDGTMLVLSAPSFPVRALQLSTAPSCFLSSAPRCARGASGAWLSGPRRWWA